MNKVKYLLLTKEKIHLNKRGKFTGIEMTMMREKKLAVGPGKYLSVKPQILAVMESLISSGCHFVIQSSEGDGIKVIGNDGMTRCVILIRSGVMQTFNLKANTAIAKGIIKKIGLDEGHVNLRKQSKSEYVYTDFSEECKPDKITKFILELPPSSVCTCGHKKDIKKKIL